MNHNNFPEKNMQFREEKHFVSIESIERKLNIVRMATQTESKISVSGHAFPSLYKIHFQNTYRNITSIELVSANIGLTCDGSLANPNELVEEPYVLLILDEVDGMFDSANINISNAFAKIPTSSSGTFIRDAGGGTNYRKVYYPNPLGSLNALTIRLVKNSGELVNFGPEYFNTPCSCRYYTQEEMTAMNLEIGSTYMFSDKETPYYTHIGTITNINIPKLCTEVSGNATITIENRKSITTNAYLEIFNKNYNIICEIYSTLKGYKKYLPEIYDNTIKGKIIDANLGDIGDDDTKFDFNEEYITTYEKFNNWLNKEKYKIKEWCKNKAKFYDELYNKKNNECNKTEKNTIVVENEARCKAISIVESIICNLENYVTYLKDTILNADDLDTIGFDINDINSANDITNIINYLYSNYLSKCNKKTTLEIPNETNVIKWEEYSNTKTFGINSATGIDFEKEIIEVNSKDDIRKKCTVDKINFSCPLVRSFNNYRPKEVGKYIKQRNLTFKTESSVEDCCTDEPWKKYAYVESCPGYIDTGIITIEKSKCCTKNYKVGNYLQINDGDTIEYPIITKVECNEDDILITVDNSTLNDAITICHQATVNVLNKCKNCCNLEECCFNKWIQNSFTFCITTREQASAFQTHNLHY